MWEEGQNRIANMTTMGVSKNGKVSLNDKWNSFKVNFEVFYPFVFEDSEQVQLQLVHQNSSVDMHLKDMEEEENWIVEKYGSDKFVTPYQVTQEFMYDQLEGMTLHYSY